MTAVWAEDGEVIPRAKEGSHKPQAAMVAQSTNFNQRTRVYLFEKNRASFAGADAVFKKMQKKIANSRKTIDNGDFFV
ncbi:MAG: hypothetical protein IJD01_01835 [Clostridia bacterium]|nr:hypothetical protein [Clostridia bacterium]